MIRVTVVSANHALRVGLRELLADQPDIEVIGEAIDLESVNEKETEVVVLASVSSARILENRTDFAILYLTDDVETIRAVVDSNARAWGVLSSNATGEEMAAAIRAVGEGLWVGAPNLMRSLMRVSRGREISGEDALVEPLTVRELEVIELMAQGLANKQMALALGISEHTIKFHLSSLYAKMNVSSRTEAIKRGIELGLISL